ncbi:MAG: glycosyltransferase [Candidatus Thermoplasmatota archaeon]|nr:glycosyltransferase [Candidatus Thermoplasmatota archaeon]
MRTRIRILVIKPSRASFVEQDSEILQKHFDVRTIDLSDAGRSVGCRMNILLRLLRGIAWADVTFSWFADVYALWAVRLSRTLLRKSIVVVGGYETARIEELGYGLLTTPNGEKMVRKILSKADLVLAVSEFVRREVSDLSPNSRVSVIPLGIDPSRLPPPTEKENMVLTVGPATEDRVVLKGIDVFVKASRELPDLRFVVVGPFDESVRTRLGAISPSVEFTGWLQYEELMAHMNRAKVYCQLSVRESFGVAVAEAMALGCAPVVSDAGNLPALVGGTGFVVSPMDVDAAVAAIKKAASIGAGTKARERARTEFTVARREIALVDKINELVKF